MVTLGRTITLSGVRRTSPDDNVVVAWRVSSSLSSDASERVDYAVSANGVPVTAASATAKQIVKPNFSDQPSRLPGVTTGMAPFYGYRYVAECGSLPAGTIVVDAVAFGRDGSTKTLGSCTFYNDRDGVDRRPSTKTIYVDAQDGDDGDSGADWAHAVQTMDRAIYLCQANPGGTSAADRDCGGAQIMARGDFIGGGGGASFPWHCSGEWWLQILCEPGTTWSRVNAPWFVDPTDLVCMRGNGAGTTPRLRITNCNFVGAGPVGAVDSGVLARVWVDGGKSGSATFVDDGKVSVRWADDSNSIWSFYGPSTADQDAGRVFITGHRREGVIYGLGHDSLSYDCEVRGFLMNAYWIVGPQKVNCLLSCAAHLQRYAQGPGQVEGWVRHTGGSGFEVQTPGGGVMRILGPVSGYNFGRDAAGMLGSSRWGVGCYGFPQAANNGTFELIGTGVTGGRSYVDVDNPSAVVGAGGSSTYLETTERSPFGGSPYNTVVHTNGLSLGPERTGDDIVSDCAIYDCTGVASDIFTNGADHTRLLVENLRGPGDGKQILMANSSITDSLIFNCSFTGPWLISHFTPGELPALDFRGLQVVNSVFGNVGSASPEIVSLGARVVSCHFYSGVTIGDGATSGVPQLAGNPLVSPWSFEPHASRIGTGTPHMTEPKAWAWSPTATTRGVLKNVANLDWSTGVVGGGATMSPDPAEQATTTVDPTWILGPATISPSVAEQVTGTVLAAISAGGAVMQVNPGEQTTETVLGTISLGPATITPAIAQQVTGTVAPQIFTVGATGEVQQLAQVVRAPARLPEDDDQAP